MSIVDKFGEEVGEVAEKDPVKARKLLLAGYRLQEKRLALFPDRKLPMSGQYVAKIVMNNIIQALAKPENAAMVSIFVPGELLTAAGLTPYSVEALSCFIAGTKCEQAFLRQTEKEGFPETMCSYHRVFLGAALNGIVPKPKCMVYTNLACDGNMMTFPYLKERYEIPSFYIDVPYEKNYDSVMYVAKQLRELKNFLQDVTGRKITEESVKKAVDKSKIASNNYYRQLHLRKGHDIASTLTNELYALFMCHLLAGTDESVRYTQLLRDDVRRAPGMDVIVTGYVGLEGTAILANEKRAELETRFSKTFIDKSAAYIDHISTAMEAASAIGAGVAAIHDASQGGIFGALWDMAEASGIGLDIDLKKLPIRQDTIEISEFFDINPYKLLSGGSLIIIAADGTRVLRELEKTGQNAVIVGATTDSNDRVLISGEERRFLETAQTDEIYKVFN